MNIKIIPFEERYRTQLEKLFDDFQNFITENLDTYRWSIHLKDYGEKVVTNNLVEIKKKGGVMLIAINDEKVIGFVMGTIVHQSKEDLLEAKPMIMGETNELYVDPKYRGKGVGKQLLIGVEEFFRKKKCEFLWLSVASVNVNAYDFYKNNGYVDHDFNMIKKLSER